MPRAPYNILALPFRNDKAGELEFAVFKRAGKDEFTGIWQFISGGGEDNESVEDALKRECIEEASIPYDAKYYKLDMMFYVPKFNYPGGMVNWPQDLYLIPNYCFAVDCNEIEIKLSHEHTDFKWLSYKKCIEILHFLSNKNAMWELKERIHRNDLILI